MRRDGGFRPPTSGRTSLADTFFLSILLPLSSRPCICWAFVDSPRRRQTVQRALNRGEQFHHLKKALTHGHAGKLRYISEAEQEVWNEASRLLVNLIIFYNMTILEQAIAVQEAAGNAAAVTFLRSISPVAWHHLNLGGQWTFYGDGAPAPVAACVAAVVAYRPAVTEQQDDAPAPPPEDT